MNTLKKLQFYMGKRKVLMPIALTLSGLSGLLSLMPFIFIWLIVRSLLSTGSVATGIPINVYAWWAVGTAVAGLVIYFVGLMLSHLAAFRVETNMRRTAMRKIMQMPLGFFDRNTSGQMRKIIDENASETHTFVAHLLPDLAGSFIAPLSVIILIFVFNWQLGLACLIPLTAAVFIMTRMNTTAQKAFQNEYLGAQEHMSSEAVEYVRGIPVVKVFQQTVFSFKRFYDSIIAYRDLVTKYTLGWQKPMSLYTVAINSFAFLLVPIAILLIGNKSENIAPIITDMFLYVLITPVIATNVMKVMYLQQDMFLADQAISRVENLTSSEPLPIAENPEKITACDVTFENVSFAYPNAGQNAVDGISFHLPEGKTFALVGQSGGGKTTIAQLIPRFWDVSAGSVTIGGINVKNIAKDNLINHIAFVFQNTKLFKTSLLENIKYGNPAASDEAVQRAIDLSQSREIIDRLPNGLNTKIGVDGTFLSGGEQQRIVLARAILKDAPIVVLDEATAFADPENEHLIQKALHELRKGKTVLMIAHRLTSVQDADKILVIAQGKIAEEGTHSELIARNGIYNSMWNEYQRTVTWTV